MSFKAKKVDKSWGYEIHRVNNKEENYCSKILFIEKGKGTSMHYHLKKHETFYVREGMLLVTTIDTQTIESTVTALLPGECMEIPRGIAHRLSADEDSPVEFDETSTYSEDSDSYRVWR